MTKSTMQLAVEFRLTVILFFNRHVKANGNLLTWEATSIYIPSSYFKALTLLITCKIQ